MALFGPGKKVDELLQATYRGDRQAVFRLVRDGVKTGAKNKSGLAAMHVIAYLSDDRTGIMDNLLFGKADVNEPEDNYGWTPLHIAAGMGNLKVAGQLIAKGADVNVRDKHGHALDMAAAQSEKPHVRLPADQGRRGRHRHDRLRTAGDPGQQGRQGHRRDCRSGREKCAKKE